MVLKLVLDLCFLHFLVPEFVLSPFIRYSGHEFGRGGGNSKEIIIDDNE